MNSNNKKPHIAHIAVEGRHTHADTHTRTLTHTHTRTCTHTHTHAHTRTHTQHTHTHAHTQSTCDVTEVIMEDMFVSCNLDQKVGL